MKPSRPLLVLAASAAFALGPIVSCGGPEVAYNPGGTLPPIRTTTSLSGADTTSSPYFLHYKLKRGENLGMVAKAFKIPLEVLIEYNRETIGDKPSNLAIGTEIVIPPNRYLESLPPPTSTTTTTLAS